MSEAALRMATAEAVWELLAREVQTGPSEAVALDRAIGRVCAADVRSTIDYPPFDRALMDGFAVRSADCSGEAFTLRLAGLARAGVAASGQIEPGECLQINTGALVPPWVDAIVPVEKSRVGADRVELRDRVKAGQHIERRAAHVRSGDLLLPLAPQSVRAPGRDRRGGLTTLTVARAPEVAILTTGDELVAGGVTLHEGQIYDSNGVMLAALATADGGATRPPARCPDEAARLRETLERGLSADLLCVAGGMSKGSHDLVPRALEQLGVRWLVESLNLKPGKPTRIGRTPRGGWVIGLPGNPVSCAVCYLLFARVILRGLSGRAVQPPPMLRARVGCELPASGERPMFHPADCWTDATGDLHVSPIVWRGSGDPFGMAGANSLLRRRSHEPALARGELVSVFLLETPR